MSGAVEHLLIPEHCASASPPHLPLPYLVNHRPVPTLSHKPPSTLVQGTYKEAGELYERAIGIWKRNLGKVHPQVATGLSNWAELLQSQVRGLHAYRLTGYVL